MILVLVKSVPLKSALQPTTYCTPLTSVAKTPLSSGHLPTPVPTGAGPEEVIDATLEVAAAAELVVLAGEVRIGGDCAALDMLETSLDTALLTEEPMLDVREDSKDDTAEEMLELMEDMLDATALEEASKTSEVLEGTRDEDAASTLETALEITDDQLETSLEVLEA